MCKHPTRRWGQRSSSIVYHLPSIFELWSLIFSVKNKTKVQWNSTYDIKDTAHPFNTVFNVSIDTTMAISVCVCLRVPNAVMNTTTKWVCFCLTPLGSQSLLRTVVWAEFPEELCWMARSLWNLACLLVQPRTICSEVDCPSQINH